jgi:hypothetical protein
MEDWGARFNNLKQNACSTEILSHRSWKMATKPCDRKQDVSGFVRKDHQNMKKITAKLLTFWEECRNGMNGTKLPFRLLLK